MRMACIFFALLFLAQNPAKKPDRADTHGKNQADDATSPLRQAEPITVNCNQGTGAVAEHDTNEAPKWYTAVEWANWALVLVAGITGYFIWVQAKETAKATQAMRDSTAIQQAQLVQWVELPEWDGGKEISLDEADDPQHFLMLTFPIVNPTNYPMILDRIEWSITEQGAEQKGSLSFNGITFPPRERHPTVIDYTMTMDQVHRYAGDERQHQETFYLDIGGTVHFIDISKKPQSQEFWVRLHCYHGKGVLAWKPYRTAGLVANKKVWKKPAEKDK